MTIFNVEDIFDFEGAKELFDKHQFDYAVCTATDFDFSKNRDGTWKLEIGWDQLSMDDIIMRNCSGKDCIVQDSEYVGKHKACYYGVSMRNVLEDNNIEY